MGSPLISVFQAIHSLQPVTRRPLAERVGLAQSRISTLVGQLVARGLVREEVLPHGALGRPAASLGVNPEAGRVVGIDIGGGHSRAVLADLAGNVLALEVHPSHVVPDRELILANIVRLVEETCEKGNLRPRDLKALGVGVQGIVNTRTGVVLGWPNTPLWAAGWAGLPLTSELGERLGSDLVVVDDSVRAMGMVAQRFGLAQGCRNFLYVFLGNGIGFGMFVDGHPYRGSSGVAGELGHVTVDEQGPWCSCGNRGCLEVLASTTAVLRRVRERLARSQLSSMLLAAYERDELTLDVLLAAARAGDKLAFQVLDETGAYVGQVLAMALNLLGLEVVLLGGPLAQENPIILEAVQRQVRLHALQYISSQTRIVSDDQGEMAGARGAALLALDALFASERHLAALLGRPIPA